jgi:hypothetical protein
MYSYCHKHHVWGHPQWHADSSNNRLFGQDNMALVQVVRGLKVVQSALSWEEHEVGGSVGPQLEGPTALERKSLRLVAVRAACRFLGIGAAWISQVLKPWRQAGSVEDLALLYSNLADVLSATRVILMVCYL